MHKNQKNCSNNVSHEVKKYYRRCAAYFPSQYISLGISYWTKYIFQHGMMTLNSKTWMIFVPCSIYSSFIVDFSSLEVEIIRPFLLSKIEIFSNSESLSKELRFWWLSKASLYMSNFPYSVPSDVQFSIFVHYLRYSVVYWNLYILLRNGGLLLPF